jgi:hypothetical protein
MRKLVTIAFALICLLLAAAPASAKSVRIGVLVSSSTLQLRCSEAHGVFRENGSGYDCYAPGGTINCNSGGECRGSCTNCLKASDGNVSGVLKPSPVPPRGGTSVTTTVNGNTIVRDHRNAAPAVPTGVGAPSASAPGTGSPPTAGNATATEVRDHRGRAR